MPKWKKFRHFLASSEDNYFLVEKEDMSSKRRTYGKPKPSVADQHRFFLRFSLPPFDTVLLSKIM